MKATEARRIKTYLNEMVTLMYLQEFYPCLEVTIITKKCDINVYAHSSDKIYDPEEISADLDNWLEEGAEKVVHNYNEGEFSGIRIRWRIANEQSDEER